MKPKVLLLSLSLLLGISGAVAEEKTSDTLILKDTKHLLIWQDQSYTKKELDAYKEDYNKGKVGNWGYADQYCRALVLNGYSNWRLPTKEELLTNYKEKCQFNSGNAHSYWSSTPGDEEEKHYAVYFRTGDVNAFDDVVHYYIRCVHSTK
ncbi:MAG: DUF1566 domain-containing protein [Campylobacterota bacterium]|nr:DUF1566 domain-containing protein [Campylobacterota bacterium]